MSASRQQAETGQARQEGGPVRYHLCPRCFRAVPAQTGERYCANDGERLLSGCPACGAPIHSPYARHCVTCGAALARTGGADEQDAPPGTARQGGRM